MRTKTPLLPVQEMLIEVQGDHITLGQLLKVVGIISSGGEAKHYLFDMVVFVNGLEEGRRGRKLRPGDLILCKNFEPIRLIAPGTNDDVAQDSD